MRKRSCVVLVWISSLLLFASLLWASLGMGASAQDSATSEVTPLSTPRPDAVVYVVLFYSPTCPACHQVITEFLPPVVDRYGGQVKIIPLNTAEPQNSELLLEVAQQAGLEDYGVPFMVIGSQILIGARDIPQHFERIVDEYIAAGGVGPLGGPIPTPVTEGTPGATTPTPAPTPTPIPQGKTIAMAYFYAAGCNECDKAAIDLTYLKGKYPQVVIQEFNIDENQPLNACLSRDRGVPRERWLASPSLFVGDDYLLPEDLTVQNLLALAEKYVATGAKPVWEGYDLDRCRELVKGEFKAFSVLTVLGAGLVDGLNPCAFATIVFFVSYLSFTGRKGREVLLVGGSFALGIFLTYLLVGLGLSRVAETVDALGLAPWLYGIIAALCLTLAILSLRDYLKARRGEVTDMTLRLPMNLRRWINRVIRESAQARAFVLIAFLTGIVISLIELACTGQVYLPTIVYVMGDANLRVQAILYLVLYNLAFIVPLVVVFILAFFGTTSEQLGQFLNKRTATVKLMTVVVFLILTGWLTYSLVQLVPGLTL
jgi:cytochrome c biogenesis protein CcdA